MISKQNFSQVALTVLESRYLARDENGNIKETPEQMFWRVAWNIACAEAIYKFKINKKPTDPLLYEEIEKDPEKKAIVEEWAKKFYKAMISFDFLPNSPTLMNAGCRLQQLSACFVLPINDAIGDENSEDAIFDAVKNTSIIHKTGGGTGMSFSRCRQKNAIVRSTGMLASGPVSWLKVIDSATDAIKQGGKRRGANMGILSVHHPDIEEFIRCKEKEGDIHNFNISVALTNEFMEALENDGEYNIIEPHTGRIIGKKNAMNIMRLIAHYAWLNGEPGIVFIDRMNLPETNSTPALGRIESTNPCGEVPLLPYESCNLGSINLANFVTSDKKIDWNRLKETIFLVTRFMDNVIEMNNYPLSKIEKMTKGNRKIGIGVMGWADMLVSLGVPYNSDEALELAEVVMEFISYYSKLYSIELAKERGPFPNFEISLWKDNAADKIYEREDSKLNWADLREKIKKHGIRNATTTAIAPTGTIAIIANASHGIEPYFALVYERRTPTFTLYESNPLFEKIAKERGFYSEELIKTLSKTFSIQHIEEIPEDVKKVFLTAHDLTPEDHILMQARFQKYTDNSVSKTINFKNTATEDDMFNAYMLAWRENCKGLTVYRDGSRKVQVINVKKEQPEVLREPENRPEIMYGSTYKIKTGYGNMYITINNNEKNKPFEVFATIGKSGGILAAKCEAISRMISLALRSGIDPEEIITQLKGIRGPITTFSKIGTIYSIPDAIVKVLEIHINKWQKNLKDFKQNGNQKKFVDIADTGALPECPDCHGILEIKEGCLICNNCGYSKCA